MQPDRIVGPLRGKGLDHRQVLVAGAGTVVPHITSESAIGGPLGLIGNGETIRLDVPVREIARLTDEAERGLRRGSMSRPPISPRHPMVIETCTSLRSRRPMKGAISILAAPLIQAFEAALSSPVATRSSRAS